MTDIPNKHSLLLFAVLAVLACNKPEVIPDSGEEPEEVDNPVTITVDFSMDKDKAFVDEEVTFTPSVSGGTEPYAYAWSFDGEATSSEANPTVSFATAGVKVISLTLTDANGDKPVRTKYRTFLVEEIPVEETGDITLAWYTLFGDKGGGVRGSSPAVDDAGNASCSPRPNSPVPDNPVCRRLSTQTETSTPAAAAAAAVSSASTTATSA